MSACTVPRHPGIIYATCQAFWMIKQGHCGSICKRVNIRRQAGTSSFCDWLAIVKSSCWRSAEAAYCLQHNDVSIGCRPSSWQRVFDHKQITWVLKSLDLVKNKVALRCIDAKAGLNGVSTGMQRPESAIIPSWLADCKTMAKCDYFWSSKDRDCAMLISLHLIHSSVVIGDCCDNEDWRWLYH